MVESLTSNEMKKTYQVPEAEILAYDLQHILEASVGVTSDHGIDYGGIDEDGGKDPESRGLYDRYEAWSDTNEESYW